MLDIEMTEDDTLLELTGRILLVELTRAVVVVAPDATVVTVSVMTSLPITPSFRVCCH
jgi:hypothetical protein